MFTVHSTRALRTSFTKGHAIAALSICSIVLAASWPHPAAAYDVHFSATNSGPALTPWSGIIYGSTDVVDFVETPGGSRTWSNEATLVADPPIPAENWFPNLARGRQAMYQLIQAIVDWILSSYYPSNPTALGEVSAYQFQTTVQATNDAHGIVVLAQGQALGDQGFLGSLNVSIEEPFVYCMNAYTVTGEMVAVSETEVEITGTAVLPLQDGTELVLDIEGYSIMPFPNPLPWPFPWPFPLWSLGGSFDMAQSEPQTWAITSTYTEEGQQVDVAAGIVPRDILLTSVPNPFGTDTTLRFHLDTPARVTVDILDVSGRAVRRLAGGMRPKGAQYVVWDGRSDLGHRVGAGVYWGRLRVGNETQGVERLVVLD